MVDGFEYGERIILVFIYGEEIFVKMFYFLRCD